MASLYKVDIGGLLAGGRQRLAVDQQVDLEPFEGVRFSKPAQVHLEMHASGAILEIGGSIDAEYQGECDRCLGAVDRRMHVEVDEQLDAATDSIKDPFGPGNVLTGDRLDVRDLATQLVCSAIPLTLVCAENCQGICPQCGQNRNTGECACPEAGE
jgi:uncharacterized protein